MDRIKELTKKLRVNRAYMSNLENGKKNSTLATIEKIVGALNVSLADLM